MERGVTLKEIGNGDDLTTIGGIGTKRLLFEIPPEGGAALFPAPENGERKPAKKIIPKLEWPSSHDPTLTNTVRRLLRVLWAIVVSRALHLSFPLHSTIISVFEDPTEDDRKIVLSATSDANMSQALAFWDSLERDLQNWLTTLNKNDRLTFISRITLQVNWR